MKKIYWKKALQRCVKVNVLYKMIKKCLHKIVQFTYRIKLNNDGVPFWKLSILLFCNLCARSVNMNDLKHDEYRPKMRNKLVQAQVAFPLISNFSAHSVAKMDILSQILT
jgi:hypothetical protein